MNPRTRRLRKLRRAGAAEDRRLRALVGPDWTLILPSTAFDWIGEHRFPRTRPIASVTIWRYIGPPLLLRGNLAPADCERLIAHVRNHRDCTIVAPPGVSIEWLPGGRACSR